MEQMHRRESERGLLDADLEDQDEEGLGDGFATPPLQQSPSWSLSRSRINSYRVMKHILDLIIKYHKIKQNVTLLLPQYVEWHLSDWTYRIPAYDTEPCGQHPPGRTHTCKQMHFHALRLMSVDVCIAWVIK